MRKWGNEVRETVPSPHHPVSPFPHLLRKIAAVFLREMRTEMRSRYALNAIGMFAVITLLVVAMAVGSNIPHRTMAGLLWILLFFSAMTGLARVFVREVEARTEDALRLTADPTALLLGKALFNAALLGAVQAVVVPLFALMMRLPVRHAELLLLLLILGNLGLTLASTILAAIVAKAGGRSALFPVLALPILLPLLLALVGGTYAALVPDLAAGTAPASDPLEARRAVWEAGWPYVRLALAYIGMLGPASVLLFDLIWDED